MWVAAHDLGRDRGLDVGEVEHARLRGKLRMQDDLQPQIPELTGELRRRTGFEGVVDLVRLFEQVVAQGLMRLLAVPRATVGFPQTIADRRHGPGSGDSRLGRERDEVQRRAEIALHEATDRRGRHCAEAADRMVGRVRPAQDLQRVAPTWAVATGQWAGLDVGHLGGCRRPKHRQGHDQRGSRGLERRRDQALGRHDLEAPGRIESEPESRLRDERIEHRRAA